MKTTAIQTSPSLITNLLEDQFSPKPSTLNVALAMSALSLDRQPDVELRYQREMMESPMWQQLCRNVEGVRNAGSLLGFEFLAACVQVYHAGVHAGSAAATSKLSRHPECDLFQSPALHN